MFLHYTGGSCNLSSGLWEFPAHKPLCRCSWGILPLQQVVADCHRNSFCCFCFQIQGAQVSEVCVQRNGKHVHWGAEVVCQSPDGKLREHACVQRRLRVQAAEAETQSQHLNNWHGRRKREPAFQVGRCVVVLPGGKLHAHDSVQFVGTKIPAADFCSVHT